MKDKKKLNIKQIKENTIKSLVEVENFLRNVKKLKKGATLYKIIRK